MTLYRKKYRVESARLKDYDYSLPGFYFVTICTRNREHFFGKIRQNEMILSEIGIVAEKFWQEIPDHFMNVQLDAYVIMPNHVHGIVQIVPSQNGPSQNVETQDFASLRPSLFSPDSGNKFGPQSRNLASIIRGYKTGVKKWATMNGIEFSWQSRFHDHIIRDDNALQRIRMYIQQNPRKWKDGIA